MRPWLVAALIALAAPVQAQILDVTPAVVAKLLKENRFELRGIDRDNTFTEVSARHRGSNFSVLFFNCVSQADCLSIQFETGYTVDKPPSLDRINEWNRDQTFAKAHLDEEGYPWLEMDVGIAGGVTRAALLAQMETWADLMEEFEEYIAW